MVSCKEEKQVTNLETGKYRATLQVNDTLNLPFNFEVVNDSTLKIFNAEEVIAVNEITYKNDSVYIQMSVFEGFIVAKINIETLNGSFVKPNLNRVMPYAAYNNDTRFDITEETTYNITGNW